MKVGFISDLHLGLTTNDLDRTEEIINISLDFVKHAIKNKLDYVVFGGDIFHSSNPSEYLIGQFLRVINLLQKYNLKTYIIVGNHDSISSESRKSCLDFINKLKFYPDIKLISDIKSIEVKKTDVGSIYFTFLPHITKSHLKNSKYNTTQQYIDGKAKAIYKKVGLGNHNIVFSHLNVKGFIPVKGDDFLKKSTVFLPNVFLENQVDGSILPEILQGHIHSHEVVNNINVVGSPIYVSFGERFDEKCFAVVNIPETFGEQLKVDFINTNAIKFKECDFDFRNFENSMLDIFNKEEFLESVENKILKFNIIIDEEFEIVNWNQILKNVLDRCHYLKPIVPKVVRKKIKRDVNQKIELSPLDAVKVWFKKNKSKNIKDKYILAKKIIMECNENI